MNDPVEAVKKTVDADATAANKGGNGTDDHSTSGSKDGSVPLATFLELKKGAKQLEDDIKQLKADQKAREDAKLAEDGKLQELIDAKKQELSEIIIERDSLKLKADEFEQFKSSKVEEAKSQLGDKWNDEYSKLSLIALDKLVKSMVALPPGVKTDGGVTGDKVYIELTAEQKKEAKAMYPHISEEKAFEYHRHNLIKTGKIKPKE